MSAADEPDADAVSTPCTVAPSCPNGNFPADRADVALGEQTVGPDKEEIPSAPEQEKEDSDKGNVHDGETEEEALERRIDEGKVGKGRTLRRWMDTEEKQRRVETGRYESKVQRYDQIYEEVRALRKETRLSVQDLRERFKKEGVIQNKDQFIVRLIAQERNEQEGKVAAIRSLQQWRLTDVELHNFLNRCHKRGIEGKLELASQWVYEQETAGGEANFKEGLAFYSSIGIIQPRSSAQTQQQWREWREWEDAMTAAIEKRRSRGSAADPSATPNEKESEAGPDASFAEDSTACNSPWSSERGGGGGSFGGTTGSLRTSSSHGEGDAAGGSRPSRLSGTGAELVSAGPPVRLRRGRTPMSRDSPRHKRGWWQWRSFSPPGPAARRQSEELRRAMSDLRALPAAEKRETVDGTVGRAEGEMSPVLKADAAANDTPEDDIGMIAPGTANTVAGAYGASNSPLPMPLVDPDDGAGRPGEHVVRASGGYLPPRHPLVSLSVSPKGTPSWRTNGVVDSRVGAGSETGTTDEVKASELAEDVEPEDGVEVGSPRPPNSTPPRRGLVARGAARTRAKGPAGGGTPKEDVEPIEAPTEEEGDGRALLRRAQSGDESSAQGIFFSDVLADLADWLMPGMESGRRQKGGQKHPGSPKTIPGTPTGRGVRSAPVTPRGRPKSSTVLRDGGWFYNGDSDYSSSEEFDGYESGEDLGFWEDAGTKDPRAIPGNAGMSILERLRMLFTL